MLLYNTVVLCIYICCFLKAWRLGSDMGDVQVGAADAPVRGKLLHGMVPDVFLHGGQAAAELQTQCAPIRRGPAMGSQMFDHGRVVP